MKLKHHIVCFFSTLIIVLVNISIIYARTIKASDANQLEAAIKNKDIEYIYLDPGLYVGNYTISRNDVALVANQTGTVTFRALDQEKPIITIESTLWFRKNILISGVDFISDGGGVAILGKSDSESVFKNLSIRGFNSGLIVSANNNTVKECLFERTQFPILVNEDGFINELNISNNYYNDFTLKIDIARNGNVNSIGKTILQFKDDIIKNQISPSSISSIIKTLNDVSSPSYEINQDLLKATNSSENEYLKRSTYSERYLSKILTDRKSIADNLNGIMLALQILISPPNLQWSSSDDYVGLNRIEQDGDLQSILSKGNPMFTEYLIPAIIFSDSKPPRLFKLITKDILVDQKNLLSVVPNPPSANVDVFRKNIELYKQYRENISSFLKIISRIGEFLKMDSSIPMENVTIFRQFKLNSSSSIALSDKAVRIAYFDMPLWTILLEFDAAIKNADGNEDIISELANHFSTYGVIAYKAIVSDSVKVAWDYILDEFRKGLSKKKFNEMELRAKTSPSWWKDTGGQLLEESQIR